MIRADEILQGQDFFKCERFDANLLKRRCLERQEGKNRALYGKPGLSSEPFREEVRLSFDNCKDCEQGKQIRAEMKPSRQKPRRGNGNRNAECDHYKKCLDDAVKKKWKSWKCNYCPLYEGEGKIKKPENTRICEECKKRKTLASNCPYCPKCMAGRSKKAAESKKSQDKTRNREGSNSQKKAEKTATPSKGQSEKSSPGENTAVTIEFGKHASILRDVEDLAEEKMRPLDLQIIYMLKKSLESIHRDEVLK